MIKILNHSNKCHLSNWMKHILASLSICVLTIACFGIITPLAYAEEFIPLVGIPFIDTATNPSLPGYVNALYKAAISIAAFMAVVKIIFAGVKYMLSDVVTSKEDAKKDIRGALIGLLIVIGAVLILNTINPQLKGLKALDGPDVIVTLGTHGCTQTKIDYTTGEKICIAQDGEECDVSKAGSFCGCGQTLSYTMTEPGFRCDTPASDPLPEDSQCPFPIQGNCPCGEEPGGYQIAGYSECVPSTSLPEATGTFTFNGETINSTTIYTVNDPAIPEADLPAGEHNGQTGTVIGVMTGEGVSFSNEDVSSSNRDTTLIFRLADGTVVWGIGCANFTPIIPGCSR